MGSLPAFLVSASARIRDLDVDFLRNKLTAAEKRQLGGKKWQWNHMMHYGEVIAVLAGLKPCMFVAHGECAWFADRFSSCCLEPLMKEFELAAKGFELHRIEHRLLTSNPGPQRLFLPPACPAAQCTSASSVHAEHPLVRRTFLVPSPAPVPEEQIGRALGYPTVMGSKGTISYIDATTSEEHGVCCCDVIQYFGGGQPAMLEAGPIYDHYMTWRTLWAQLGRKLNIDLASYPGLKQHLAAYLMQQQRAGNPVM